MATEYLTLEEVCEALGVDASQVKAMVAEGRLHEFRDAGKVFFKRVEIDKMAAKEGSSIVDLAAADELVADGGGENESFASALSSLADSSSSLGLGDISPGTAEAPPDLPSELNLMDEPSPAAASDSSSGLGLSPLEMSPQDFPQELPAAPANKELTSEIDLLPTDEAEAKPAKSPAKPAASTQVPDLGLSGSSIISLTPSGEEEAPARPAPKPAAAKNTISVFEDDEVEIAVDPMGETRISAGVDELEAVGSGSGLLDLTQVNDDTSLGAELLDVISPSATEGEATETEAEVVEAAETVEDSGAILAETMPETTPAMAAPTSVSMPAKAAAYTAVTMPGETLINVTLLLGILSTVLIGLCAAGQLQGVWPSFLSPIARDVGHYATFGGLGLIAIVVGVLGILAGRK